MTAGTATGTDVRPIGGAQEGPTDVWPGSPYPLGASYDGAGTNFSVFSEMAEGIELCLFARRRGNPGPAAGNNRLLLARLSARRAARATLRLSSARPLQPGQPASAATRTSCCSTPMPRPSTARWSGASRPYAVRRSAGRPDLRIDDQRLGGVDAQGHRGRPGLRLGR